jgi:hypothetical protein
MLPDECGRTLTEDVWVAKHLREALTRLFLKADMANGYLFFFVYEKGTITKWGCYVKGKM